MTTGFDKYCSDACRAVPVEARRLAKLGPATRHCLVCGAEFVRVDRQVYCSPQCQARRSRINALIAKRGSLAQQAATIAAKLEEGGS